MQSDAGGREQWVRPTYSRPLSRANGAGLGRHRGPLRSEQGQLKPPARCSEARVGAIYPNPDARRGARRVPSVDRSTRRRCAGSDRVCARRAQCRLDTSSRSCDVGPRVLACGARRRDGSDVVAIVGSAGNRTAYRCANIDARDGGARGPTFNPATKSLAAAAHSADGVHRRARVRVASSTSRRRRRPGGGRRRPRGFSVLITPGGGSHVKKVARPPNPSVHRRARPRRVRRAARASRRGRRSRGTTAVSTRIRYFYKQGGW